MQVAIFVLKTPTLLLSCGGPFPILHASGSMEVYSNKSLTNKFIFQKITQKLVRQKLNLKFELKNYADQEIPLKISNY
jgi:hypothetical protein